MTITITENQSIVTFNNVASSYENSFICSILDGAANAGVNVDMIAQSPTTSDKISFGFTFADDDIAKLLPIINGCKLSVAPLINSGNVKVTVKSDEMVNNTGFAAKIFTILKNLNCVPLLVTTGIDEVSLLILSSEGADLERELKDVFK